MNEIINNHALWIPDSPHKTQMGLFKAHIEKQFNLTFNDYEALHQWSVVHYDLFWQQIWGFCNVVFSKAPVRIATVGIHFHQTKWFEGSLLNYAENLLQRRDKHIAIVSVLENGDRREFSYQELYEHVSRLAQHFKSLGVGVGDRVAAIVPNTFEAVIAMLATSSVGAIWSSCSPDFGVNAALDRFSQIEPKVLIGVDGYCYGGKVIDCRDKLIELHENLQPLQSISIPLLERIGLLENTHQKNNDWDYLLASYTSTDISFAQLPFNHPLFILYSSGTTGKPKCIIHSAGGTLLQHRKEHLLHTDLRQDDVFFYFTTCGWMMWNWLVTGLAGGTTLYQFAINMQT